MKSAELTEQNLERITELLDRFKSLDEKLVTRVNSTEATIEGVIASNLSLIEIAECIDDLVNALVPVRQCLRWVLEDDSKSVETLIDGAERFLTKAYQTYA